MQDGRKTLCYGFHAVSSVLDHRPSDILGIHVKTAARGRIRDLAERAARQGIPVRRCRGAELDDLADSGSHRGVVALLASERPAAGSTLQQVLESATGPGSVILVLDRLQDPRNFGACLRVAECAGVRAVVVPGEGSSPVTPVVSRVSAGAVDSLEILEVPNLVSALKQLKQQGFWIYGAAEQGSASLYDCRFEGRVALVMGSEGKGLRRLTRETCDFLVRLPVLGRISSLNVSVAAGICLYEINRQMGRLGSSPAG